MQFATSTYRFNKCKYSLLKRCQFYCARAACIEGLPELSHTVKLSSLRWAPPGKQESAACFDGVTEELNAMELQNFSVETPPNYTQPKAVLPLTESGSRFGP